MSLNFTKYILIACLWIKLHIFKCFYEYVQYLDILSTEWVLA